KLTIEAKPFVDAGNCCFYRTIARDPAEIAVSDNNRPRPRAWLPTAYGARPAFEFYRVAFLACRQCRRLVSAPSGMRLVLGALVFVQGPRDRIVGEAVLKHGTGVIQDD